MASRTLAFSAPQHRARLLARLAICKPPTATLSPGVLALQVLLGYNAILRMNLTQAIREAAAEGYDLGYSSMDELLTLINTVITQAVPFDETSLVGCPVNALLDPLMNMPNGYALFRSAEFNTAFGVILNEWSTFLDSPASCTYLNEVAPTGWFCPVALQTTDITQFICDPTKPHYGFQSWNDYFTRLFKAGSRPIDSPTNNKVIVSACEASPYAIQSNLQRSDQFWMKNQPYSLADIFSPPYRTLMLPFEGGDAYQAFLSADNYHRWHAPVSGTVVYQYNVAGTYYSDTEFAGYDPAGPNLSQGYLTAVAARAVVVIDCVDKSIGLVACVFVGMAEISSNMITVQKGSVVNKGDEIGYFQYGGSTHCVFFRPGVIKEFVYQPPFDMNAPPVHLGKTIAIAN